MRLAERLKKLLPNRHPLRLLYHRCRGLLAAAWYGFPARKLRIIGITGTDGKTTTVGMIAHILHTQHIPVGALSTAFFRIRDSVTWNATQKTSPSPFLIQRFLSRLVAEGCTHAVLECSSHGLVQGRLSCTWPAVAGYTNITPEHLDYHGTMEQYRRDKARLFRMLRRSGTRVLNVDDPALAILDTGASRRRIRYSTQAPLDPNSTEHDTALWISDVSPTDRGVTALVHHSGDATVRRLELAIPGEFNVQNALCAIGAVSAVGISIGDALLALRTFTGVPGRMERIEAGQPFAVYIDFTVTPASYEHTLHALRRTLKPGGRLIVLAGSCGDRMREKRPLVGRLCSQLADHFLVTNEDPYTEDPERIIDEVWSGIDASRLASCERILDRRQAISRALTMAQPNDSVLLCGKGSDTTMWVKTGQIPWNEREITLELLREAGYASK